MFFYDICSNNFFYLVFLAVLKGEMSAKTTYQRNAKGPINIADVSPDGKFIQLENTGLKFE